MPDRPMRILYCIEAMGPGGTEKQLAALVQRLAPRIVTPHLCTLRPSEISLREIGCEVLEVSLRSFRSRAALTAVRRLRSFIRDHKIELVQTFFQDPTILAWLATLGLNVARVGSLRDMGFWRTPAKALQMRYVYSRCHGFLANSAAVARHFHECDGIPLDRIAVIHNGVNVAAGVPRLPRPDHPVVGIVANLNRPVKRVELFIRTARLVAEALPATRFVIVGDGHLRPRLEKLSRDLGVAEMVTFRGRIPDASEEIGQFDVGLLTSDSEGLPNSVLEYMAAGVPTVARRVGGNPEVVIDGDTGVLVDGQDPRAIADATVRLLRDPERRRRMGEAARAVVASRFDFDRCARLHEAYYATLLPARASSGRPAARSAGGDA